MDGISEAALHFCKYLCSSGDVTQEKLVLSKAKLKEIFSNDYQPHFPVQFLKPQTLLYALSRIGVITKNASNQEQVHFLWKQLQNHEVTEVAYIESPPPRLTKPRQRIIVNQRFTFREKNERPEAVTADKCDLCKVHLGDTSRSEHENEEIHILRAMYRKNRKDFEKIKHKIAVWVEGYDPTSTEVKIPVRPGSKVEVYINYMSRLDASSDSLKLEQIIILCPSNNIMVDRIEPSNLLAGEKKNVRMTASFGSKGHALYPLLFKIFDPNTGFTDFFVKDVIFLVQSELMDQLQPSEPFKRPCGPIIKVKEAPIIPGIPASMDSGELRATLQLKRMKFQIPSTLIRFLNNGFKAHPEMSDMEKKKLEEVLALLPSEGSTRNLLTQDNYSKLLELLLFIEEHQLNQDIHAYDMHKVALKKKGDGLWLKVPGLAEKRPSLLINDSVLVNYHGDDTVRYEGYVHKMIESEVLLGFNKEFEKKYEKKPVDIEFKINRSNLNNMHRALYILQMHKTQNIFFPTEPGKLIKQPPLRPWFNESIMGNPEQQRAVRHVVYQTSQAAPYLIFGPPGTGKTVTLTETILQLWQPEATKNQNRLLVCAPSNAAADVLTTRLLPKIMELRKKPSDYILRMYAMSRPLSEVPLTIRNAGISNHDVRTGNVCFQRVEAIMSYSIVVCTFSCAARLVSAEVPPGHFTHILMDEVGQAMEPEALIPIAGLATSSQKPGHLLSHIVMAGDPKQLGPILQSPLAIKFGLDKSLLERLMDRDVYQKSLETNRYDANMLTKLVRNYRSNENLLYVSNKLFYDNELKACGAPNIVNAACQWDGLKEKNFPLLFHGVEGQDEREGNSPSFFNRQEIDIVMDYVDKILKDHVASEKEIGIVTPYSMQVRKFQKALTIKNLKGITVGSVEQYQGQEKKVVIISTVRSRAQFMQHDYKYQLGFLRNPKRFNVAVTRAQSLLIVVGNPNVLQHDPCWLTLLSFCLEKNSYIGEPFTLDFPRIDQLSIA